MKKVICNLVSSSKLMVFSLGIIFVQNAIAQAPITNSQQLKAACENSPGNIVTISGSTKIFEPTISYQETTANCSCTFILNNDATLEFEQVKMNFTGNVTIQGANKSTLKLTKSLLKASNVNISLGGNGSQMSTSQSAIRAYAGNTTISFGEQAKMELYGVFDSSSNHSIAATGVTTLISNDRFTASITDMVFTGDNGIFLELNGFENLLKNEKISYYSKFGGISLKSNGDKNNLEAIESNFYFKTSASILYPGSDSSLKLNEIKFTGPDSNTPAAGSVTIVAGSNTASNCKIEMSEIAAGQINGGFQVSSCKNGEKGNIKLEKSGVNFGGAITFETGNLGSTEVKENRITSTTSITISTGAGGNCLSSPNITLTAPILSLCTPPVTTARQANTNQLFKAYPNPSNGDIVKLEFTDFNSSKKTIELFDLSGIGFNKVVTNSNEYQLGNLKRGIYILKVTSMLNNETQSQKLIIN